MHVPFVDLHAQYLAHRTEIDRAIADVIGGSAFIGGEFTKRFEREFAEIASVHHCVGVGNGTDALYVVLRMLGIGPGDEVITTSLSWIATSETISQSGATPVFADVDAYFNIDVDRVRELITPKTKAVIPVHLYGQAARVDELETLCAQRGLHLIEDCAQAHLATRAGRPVGTFGVAGTFSFYPGKNLGAYGDAGAIVTNDADLAQRCRMFANHGALVKHQHEMEGVNSRLDGLQAAVLSAKLPHLSAWTAARRRVAERYLRALSDIPEVRTPQTASGSSHVYHLFVISAEGRDALREWLKAEGVESQIHYPTPLPLMNAYRRLGLTRRDVPAVAELADRILSLPIYPEIPDAAVDFVCERIRKFYAR